MRPNVSVEQDVQNTDVSTLACSLDLAVISSSGFAPGSRDRRSR
jgi:hypothetical protein